MMHRSLLLPLLGSLPLLIQPAAAGFSIWLSYLGTTSCPAPGQCVPEGTHVSVGITPVGDASCGNIGNFLSGGDTTLVPHCGGGDTTINPGSFQATNCGFNEQWHFRPGPKVANGFLTGNTLEIARDPSFATVAATCFASTDRVSDKDDTCQAMAKADCVPTGWLGYSEEYWACADAPGFSTCT